MPSLMDGWPLALALIGLLLALPDVDDVWLPPLAEDVLEPVDVDVAELCTLMPPAPELSTPVAEADASAEPVLVLLEKEEAV